MNSRHSIVLMGFALASFAAASAAQAEKASILAKVSLSPAGSFEVTSESLSGKGKKTGAQYAAPELKVPVSSLKTGMSLRDDHLKEKLEVAKYPDIVVKDIKATGGSGTASLTFHGVTKPVEFKYKDLGGGFAQATFTVNLPDFKIEGINYKGVGVEDEVEVTATVPYDGK